MTLEHKKEHILRCVKLGMVLYSAMVLAECTEEEISSIEQDEIFLKRVEQQYALEEYELLQAYEIATEIATNRGITSPIQWKLQKINPKRWDSGSNNMSEHQTSIQVNLIGKDVGDDVGDD